MSSIFTKIRAIVATVTKAPDVNDLTMRTHVFDDLGADYTDIADIAVRIEDEFNIVLPENSESDVTTLGDFVRLAEQNGAK